MIPASLKGKIFLGLTFLNLGLASYFAAIEMGEQAVLSGITSFLCVGVWLVELKSGKA